MFCFKDICRYMEKYWSQPSEKDISNVMCFGRHLEKIWFCGSLALIVLWMSVIEVFDLILWCNQLLQGVIIISSVKKVFLLDKQGEICEKYIMFWERSWCFPRVNLCILDVNFKFFHKIGVDHVKFSLI